MKTLAVFASPKDLIARLQRESKNKQTNTRNNMSEELDPLNLNINLSDVDSSNPSLGVGEHPMIIVKTEIKPWKTDPSKHSCVVSLKTIDEANDTNGNTIPPGMFMFYRMSLQQQEGAFDFRKDLVRFTEAVFGEKRNFDAAMLQEALGKTVTAVVKPSKDTTYGETEIKGLKFCAE